MQNNDPRKTGPRWCKAHYGLCVQARRNGSEVEGVLAGDGHGCLCMGLVVGFAPL